MFFCTFSLIYWERRRTTLYQYSPKSCIWRTWGIINKDCKGEIVFHFVNHPWPPKYHFYLETWMFHSYSFNKTLAPGCSLSAEMNRLLRLTLLFWWQESWLVTTSGLLFTAAARIGCQLAQIKMIPTDLKMLACLSMNRTRACSVCRVIDTWALLFRAYSITAA